MVAQYAATYRNEEKRHNAKLSHSGRRGQHVAMYNNTRTQTHRQVKLISGGGGAPPAWKGMKDPQDSDKAGNSSSESGSGLTRRSLYIPNLHITPPASEFTLKEDSSREAARNIQELRCFDGAISMRMIALCSLEGAILMRITSLPRKSCAVAASKERFR